MQTNAVQNLLRAKPLWQASNQNRIATPGPQPELQREKRALEPFNPSLALACLWAGLLQSPVAFGAVFAAALAEICFQMTGGKHGAKRSWAYALLNGALLAAYFLK